VPQGDTPPVISGSAERFQGEDEKGSLHFAQIFPDPLIRRFIRWRVGKGEVA
jgi:hypothetical protein